MLFAVYVCFALSHGCKLINNATPTANQAECVATALRLDKDVKDHTSMSFRCARYAGPDKAIPM